MSDLSDELRKYVELVEGDVDGDLLERAAERIEYLETVLGVVKPKDVRVYLDYVRELEMDVGSALIRRGAGKQGVDLLAGWDKGALLRVNKALEALSGYDDSVR